MRGSATSSKTIEKVLQVGQVEIFPDEQRKVVGSIRNLNRKLRLTWSSLPLFQLLGLETGRTQISAPYIHTSYGVIFEASMRINYVRFVIFTKCFSTQYSGQDYVNVNLHETLASSAVNFQPSRRCPYLRPAYLGRQDEGGKGFALFRSTSNIPSGSGIPTSSSRRLFSSR